MIDIVSVPQLSYRMQLLEWASTLISTSVSWLTYLPLSELPMLWAVTISKVPKRYRLYEALKLHPSGLLRIQHPKARRAKAGAAYREAPDSSGCSGLWCISSIS
jgi:hypothetical protein